MSSPTFTPVDEDNLKAHVRELTAHGSRYRDNPTGVTAALTYLKKCLSGYGYTIQEEAYGKDAHEVNLFCELAGTGSTPVLEIGAHWDTVQNSPGADDNASGVAGVLELARVLQADQKIGHKLAKTVRFCLFGGEEDSPLCTGSRHHVASLKSEPDGVIVLEMIACRNKTPGSQKIPPALAADPTLKKQTTGNFIATIGIEDAAAYLTALVSAGPAYSLPVVPIKLPPGDYTATDVSRSDHRPYWQRGWKGVMVTDTAEFRYPHYHKSDDTYDKLDFEFAKEVTAAVAHAVRTLAG
jgi:Zn-dependent M28 family amino/carboxypeptidase